MAMIKTTRENRKRSSARLEEAVNQSDQSEVKAQSCNAHSLSCPLGNFRMANGADRDDSERKGHEGATALFTFEGTIDQANSSHKNGPRCDHWLLHWSSANTE